MKRFSFVSGFLLVVLAIAACTSPTPLTVTITAPEDGATVNTEKVTVEGTVSRSGATVSYKVNDGAVENAEVAGTTFTFQATLEFGENTITVTARDGEETATDTVRVAYLLEVEDGETFEYGDALTADDPLFVRPESNSDKLSGGLSVEARTVHHDVFGFSVATQDFYEIASSQQYDGYLALYEGTFDPKNPTQNLIGFNDDFGKSFDPEDDPPGISGIILELMPDTVYLLVTTAFAGQTTEEAALGEYTNSITGGAEAPPEDYELPEPNNDIYNITVRFTGGLTEAQQAVFVGAAQRWSDIITGDVENIENFNLPANFFFEGTGAITGTLDDLIIDVAGLNIDGPSGTLAAAGSLFVRAETTGDPVIPAYGIMFVDISEFEPGGFFEDPQAYEDTITHEMAHVIGFQSERFTAKGLTAGVNENDPPTVPPGLPNPDYDPRFVGATATGEYKVLLDEGTRPDEDAVPLDNTGGPGNYNSHWRELVFDNELMTPYAGGAELLSRVTAAAFGDFGYTVDLESEAIDQAYSLPLPAEFERLAPEPTVYEENVDFLRLSGAAGSAEGAVEAVDIKIDVNADPDDPNSDHPANATSGCEASDFAGFTEGNIALIQRGACDFVVKVQNAADAGAAGVILFNQGNAPDRTGLFLGLSTGLPGVSVPFDLGVELAAGATVRIGTPVASAEAAPRMLVPINEILLDPVGTIDAKGNITLFEGANLDLLEVLNERLPAEEGAREDLSR